MGRSPRISRLRKSPGKDPRLLTGIALIAGSIAVGGLTFSTLADTQTVVVAREGISQGQPLDKSKLTTAEVKVDDVSARYVTDLKSVPDGALAHADIGPGELLPKSTVGQPEESSLRPVSLSIDGTLAPTLKPGAKVEVWQASKEGENDARRIVDRGVVRSVDQGGGFSAKGAVVEVLVPDKALTEVLNSQARAEALYVIEIPGQFEVSP